MAALGYTYRFERSRLPVPAVEGKPEWVALYYKAWELAFQNIDYVGKEGWKPQLTCMPGVGTIWQWDSCLMTFITNYANGTLDAFNNLDNLKKEQAPLCLFFSILCEAYFRRRMPDHRKMMICAGMPMTNSSHALYCTRHRRHR